MLFLNDHAFYGFIVTNDLNKNKKLHQLLNKVTKDLCKLQGMIANYKKEKEKRVRLHDNQKR